MYFKEDNRKIWGFIYKFTIKEKNYVGQAINLKRRLRVHFNEKKTNPYFHNSLRKYFKSGDFHILEAVYAGKKNLRIILNEKEIFWTDKLNAYDPKQKTGWNLTKGGESSLGRKHTEETLKKMRKPKTEEAIQKMKSALPDRHGKNNSMYGVHRFGKDNPMYGVHRFGKDNPNYRHGKYSQKQKTS
jgi:group I intron endonuclease